MSVPQTGRARHWVRWLLAASLALNCLFLGLAVGSAIRDHRRGPPPSAVLELGFGPFAGALTGDDRAALRRAWIDRAPDLRGARAEMRADMAQIQTTLRAVPFDRVALEQALVQGGERARTRMGVGQALILDRIAGMSDAERTGFADRLASSTSRHGNRHRGDVSARGEEER